MNDRNNDLFQSDDTDPEAKYLKGIDELNLAELPIATLGRRNRAKIKAEDENTLTFRFRDGEGKSVIWEVTAGRYGLPTEFAERVLVILMALANKQGVFQRRLYFSVYSILKLLDMSRSNENYRRVDLALKQLTGTTIYSKGIFVDRVTGEKVYDTSGFGVLEYKLTYRETANGETVELQRNPTYIDWGERFYENFRQKHTKPLDLAFYLSLESAIARRLYRILDYKLFNRVVWYRDIFEVSDRVGLARYKIPAEVKRKLKAGADELVERKFLAKWETKRRKHKGKWYTHIIFYKHPEWTSRCASPEEVGAIRDDEVVTETAVLWSRVQEALQSKMTRQTYEAHFPQSRLVSYEDGIAVIGLASEQSCGWVENRLQDLVRQAMGSVVEDEGEIVLEFVAM